LFVVIVEPKLFEQGRSNQRARGGREGIDGNRPREHSFSVV